MVCSDLPYVQHHEQALPVIRTTGAHEASRSAIADHLEAEGMISPGRRSAHVRARRRTATAVWRIGRRHRITWSSPIVARGGERLNDRSWPPAVLPIHGVAPRIPSDQSIPWTSKEARPESNRAVERCGESQLATVEQDNLKTRCIEVLAAEIPAGRIVRMTARLVDTWPLPGDLRMSAFSADVLKTGQCRASVPDMLLEGL